MKFYGKYYFIDILYFIILSPLLHITSTHYTLPFPHILYHSFKFPSAPSLFPHPSHVYAKFVFLFVQVAGIAANLVQVALSCLFYLQVYLGDDLEPAVFWALGLLSPCAFAFGVDKVQYSTLFPIIQGFCTHGFSSVSTHLEWVYIICQQYVWL